MKHPLPSSFSNQVLQVALAGAGGNGSQMLGGLARLNIALTTLGHPGMQVTVFDPDIVTSANIGRQLFSPSDLGCSKAEVLVNRINCFYHLAWQAVPTKLTRASMRPHSGWHFLIGCVDSASARRELNRCRFQYWLDLGNSEQKGQVILGQTMEHNLGPSPAAQTARRFGRPMSRRELAEDNAWDEMKRHLLPNVLEVFPELLSRQRKPDDGPSCSLAEALERQDLFINQSVATFALQLLWQFIRQGGLDIHGFFINLQTGRVTPLPIR
jgi:PRTRC genetic system ThiF family protein